MASVKVNFADTEDQRDFSPVPEAVYSAMVTNARVGEIKNGPNAGKPRIDWEFTLQTDDKYNNRKVFDGHNLVENQLWKPKALLKAVGVEIPEGEFEFDPEDVVGEEVNIKVEIQAASKGNDGTSYKARNTVRAFYEVEQDDSDLLS